MRVWVSAKLRNDCDQLVLFVTTKAQGKRPWDRMLINAVDLDLDHCLVPANPFLRLVHFAVGGFCVFVMVVSLPQDAGICV